MAASSSDAYDEETLRAYGATSVKELSAPVSRLEDKWKLIPAFVQVRGLVKQHIASFDHFINVELKKILAANREIRSDVRTENVPCYAVVHYAASPVWRSMCKGFSSSSRTSTLGRLNWTRVWSPCPRTPGYRMSSVVFLHKRCVVSAVTPHVCRLRDLNYSGRIYVNLQYTMDRRIVTLSKVPIGMMPIMLRSSHCVLTGKSREELAGVRAVFLRLWRGSCVNDAVVPAAEDEGVPARPRRLLHYQGDRKGDSHARAAVQEPRHSREGSEK